MTDVKDGGPAFGQVVSLRAVRVEMNGDTEWEPEAIALGGLSVRDYFAAKLMPSIWQKHEPLNDYDCALRAYQMADAMLRAREKK